MYLADTLSRAYLPTTTLSPAEEETERIHAVDFLYPFQKPSWQKFSAKPPQTQYCSALLKWYWKGGQIRKKP